MSSCCINCFHDNELKKFIISKNNLGRCSYCNSRDTSICDSNLLAEKFEFLFMVLEEDSNGQEASEAIDSLFSLFNDQIRCKETLLDDILSANISGKRFSVRISTDHYKVEWDQLCNELKHTNRFFLKNEIYDSIFNQKLDGNFSRLFTILEQLEQKVIPEDVLYRARISDEKLTSQNMGAPKPQLASSGRANPKGISYLYLADNIDTCISEVRPYKGGDIYVSSFNLKGEMTLIDLTEPRRKFSIVPFSDSEYDEVLAIIELLESFSSQLSIPIKPHLSELDYIPTQFLCEYFKSLGTYDGIIFNSSFGKGKNYVFFDRDEFNISEPTVYQLEDINFSYS
ncbi:RES family NAD+ phosphorylase [Vibrio parahaemolyticus]|nr:RES family NAD+ phosphorylase [Vibrio parahaemolyticus]